MRNWTFIFSLVFFVGASLKIRSNSPLKHKEYLNSILSNSITCTVICSVFGYPYIVHALDDSLSSYLISLSDGKSLNSFLEPFAGNDFLKGLVSGAVSRASKEILLHPFDTIRARQQVPKSSIVNSGPSSSSDNSLFSNLYAGLLPALLGGIPAGAVFFGVKDYTKGYLKESHSLSLSREQSTIISVIIANIFYWIIRSPVEELKTKQQVGVDNINNNKLKFSLTSLKETYQTSGIFGIRRRLYGSYSSNIVYALPADIIKFLSYEYISNNIFHVTNGVKMAGLDGAIGGAISGLIAQAVTTPLDVVRTRIMSRSSSIGTGISNAVDWKEREKGNVASNNPTVVIKQILDEEGFSALWTGLIPRIARALGSGAIQFASYEFTQNALQG